LSERRLEQRPNIVGGEEKRLSDLSASEFAGTAAQLALRDCDACFVEVLDNGGGRYQVR
jgi:hypothetical protein